MALEVYVETIPWRGKTGITLVERRGDKVLVAKHVEIVFKEVNESVAMSCDPADMHTFALPTDTAKQLLDAMVVEFQKQGIQPKQQSYLEGKLEATEAHLEDCRHLLKLDHVINLEKKL
jgi:hypothetical protein